MSKYTPQMEAKMREMAPLDKEKAKILAVDFGFALRSVITKAQTMNIEYIGISREPSKRISKREIVKQIEEHLKLKEELNSLERANTPHLTKLLDAISNRLKKQ